MYASLLSHDLFTWFIDFTTLRLTLTHNSRLIRKKHIKCPVVSTWNSAIYGAIKHVPHTCLFSYVQMNETTDKCQSKLRIINVSFSFQHIAEYNSCAPQRFVEMSDPNSTLKVLSLNNLATYRHIYIYFLRAFISRQNYQIYYRSDYFVGSIEIELK